jgi:hypothetical protein
MAEGRMLAVAAVDQASGVGAMKRSDTLILYGL